MILDGSHLYIYLSKKYSHSIPKTSLRCLQNVLFIGFIIIKCAGSTFWSQILFVNGILIIADCYHFFSAWCSCFECSPHDLFSQNVILLVPIYCSFVSDIFVVQLFTFRKQLNSIFMSQELVVFSGSTYTYYFVSGAQRTVGSLLPCTG